MGALHTRLVCLSIVLATLAAAPLGQRRQGDASTVSVQLLAINDFHGALEPPAGAAGRVGASPAGGAAYLAAHLKRAVADQPHSLVVAAGDLVGASPLISALFHDQPTIESMDAMGLAVASVGNHEFDKGARALLELQAKARFQYLAANVVRTGTAPVETLFPATAVRNVGGVNIGFIGETLAGTARIVSPTGVRELAFLDEANAANAAAAALTARGVHAIVLLVHQGGEQAGGDDPNGCANLRGGIVPVLGRLSPDIKVVISGHTHRFYNCTFGGRTLTSAGSYGRGITRVQLTIDPAADTIQSVAARNEIVTRDVVPDAAQVALIADYGARSAPLANRVVGSVARDILRASNRAGESALGDVIADAQLAATSAPGSGGAMVAFMNQGGIRTDILSGHAGGAHPGTVTYGQLFAVQPFSNRLSVLTLTGEAIRRVLEQQFSTRVEGTQGILQVSRGFSYRYRLRAPAGQHVEPESVTLDGRPVAPTAAVRVAVVDFLAAGGDGFTVFTEGRDHVDTGLDIDALEAYVRAHSPVESGARNRIVRTD
ncbi:MAG: bifunctional metallophosphatase/5'-nucleotidase [Acidobacteriota bacterium]